MRASSAQRVAVFNAHRSYRISRVLIEKCVRSVLGNRNGEISVIFVDSRRCKTLNRTFLGHDYVTDVISFTLEPAPRLEGEVYVNLDRARQQANEYEVKFTHEVLRLVIHGTLHLIGYDDATASKRKRMTMQEDRYLQRCLSNKRRKI